MPTCLLGVLPLKKHSGVFFWYTATAPYPPLCFVRKSRHKRGKEPRSKKNIDKWSVRDVISTVLLSAVLIVIQVIVTMAAMPNHFISMVLSVGIITLLCGPVYCLLVSRVGKRGVSLVYMTILGLLYLLMGNWYLLIYFVLVGILCEVILGKKDSRQSPWRITAAWTTASLLYNGINLLPIWFFWDTYYRFAISSGMEQAYIDSYRSYYTSPGWLIFILLFSTLCGFIGSQIGKSLLVKHFKKAGVL